MATAPNKSNVTRKKKTVRAKSTSDSSARMAKDSSSDIVKLILEDHKPLKKLIKVLKDLEADMGDRRDALDEFAPLLITHAKPEEQTLYEFMKSDEDMRESGFEGDVEHTIADQLLEEIDRTEIEDLWSARVKVLAELVEHHIEEEEEELLPKFKKHSNADDRASLGNNYLSLKARLERAGSKNTPSEEEMPEQHTHL